MKQIYFSKFTIEKVKKKKKKDRHLVLVVVVVFNWEIFWSQFVFSPTFLAVHTWFCIHYINKNCFSNTEKPH